MRFTTALGVQRIMADDTEGRQARQDSVTDPVLRRVPESADFDAAYQAKP